MFNKKTVIVVGAGASCEASLPTGNELKTQITHLLNIRVDELGRGPVGGDRLISQALKLHLQHSNGQFDKIDPYVIAAQTIRNAMPMAISIDNFIDAHNGNEIIELCGKLAIVRAILQAEKNSLLYVDINQLNERVKYERLSDTWYTSFMQLLTENCRIDDLPGRFASLGLIVFNYDRCIEHFLYHALQTYYTIDKNEAARLVNDMQIYHPYGTVGYLPWQQEKDSIDFGAEPQADQLLSLAKQIKTFTEGTDTRSGQIAAIRQWVTESEIIVFLGFAFHKQNLKLLNPVNDQSPLVCATECDYYATSLGISDSDCLIIESDLMKIKSNRCRSRNLRNDLECNQLFREYWRSLSLSE